MLLYHRRFSTILLVLLSIFYLSTQFEPIFAHHEPFIVQFQWNYINYTWPNEEVYLRAAKDESYLEKSNVISGIKLWKNRMYLTIPRWRNGVPVTLAVTPAKPVRGTTAPNLEPYPNWDMQKVDDCNAFQFVQNVEIDPMGRMWVLDTGRSATMTNEAKANCPPRLVILDLENNGNVLLNYIFPPEVANPETVLLNDIVLDHEDGGVAYISDSDEKSPGLIVFMLQNLTSWRFTHDSLKANNDAIGINIEYTRVRQSFNVNGLALSPANASDNNNRILYYSPLSSFNMYSIPTRNLKDENLRYNASREIKILGRKQSQTDGMVMSNNGILYFGLLGDDAVSTYNSVAFGFTTGQRIISRDHSLMQWPDSFAFDEDGKLWVVTNRLHRFLDNSLKIDEPNFRAIMTKAGLRNYQYYENGTAPVQPVIKSGAMKNRLALTSTILAIVMVLVVQ